MTTTNTNTTITPMPFEDLVRRVDILKTYKHECLKRLQHEKMDEPSQMAFRECIDKMQAQAVVAVEALRVLDQELIETEKEWKRSKVMEVIIDVMDRTGTDRNFPIALVVQECQARYGFREIHTLNIIDDLRGTGRVKVEVTTVPNFEALIPPPSDGRNEGIDGAPEEYLEG